MFAVIQSEGLQYGEFKLATSSPRGNPMSFLIYMIGLILTVGGIAWGLVTAGLDTLYIGIACLIVFGIGMMTAVSRTRSKD